MEPWLRQKLALISQKTKLAEAIRYALSRWPGLGIFLDDGRIEFDNNIVERSIRPLALTRKNALFAGSDGGAEHWAVIASLVETCKLNGVEPQAYLTETITRIVNGHPNSRIDDLMPWAYPAKPVLSDVAGGRRLRSGSPQCRRKAQPRRWEGKTAIPSQGAIRLREDMEKAGADGGDRTRIPEGEAF